MRLEKYLGCVRGTEDESSKDFSFKSKVNTIVEELDQPRRLVSVCFAIPIGAQYTRGNCVMEKDVDRTSLNESYDSRLSVPKLEHVCEPFFLEL